MNAHTRRMVAGWLAAYEILAAIWLLWGTKPAAWFLLVTSLLWVVGIAADTKARAAGHPGSPSLDHYFKD